MVRLFIGIFLFFVLLLFCIIYYNKSKIIPSKNEITVLNSFYKSLIQIKNSKDVIALQNFTIDHIAHEPNGIGEIDIINVIKTKKGFCFHRSLLLQKVLLINAIPVRPVFLYSNSSSISTGILDFFSKKIQTHNIFEFFWQCNWYVMETNKKMD